MPTSGRMIYIVQSLAGGPVKVGYTRDRAALRQRLIKLQMGSPEKLAVLSVHDGDRKHEKACHDLMAPRRRSGEWFDVTHEQAQVVIACVLKVDVGVIHAWHRKKYGGPCEVKSAEKPRTCRQIRHLPEHMVKPWMRLRAE